MSFIFPLIFAVFLVVVSGVILAMKFFFPHHRKISLFMYIIGWIPFFYAVFNRKKDFLEYQQIIHTWIALFWVHILFLLAIVLTSYVLFILFPLARNEFVNKEYEESISLILEDRKKLLNLNESFKKLFNDKMNSFFQLDLKNNPSKKKEEIEEFWFEFLEAMFKIRMFRNRYKTFFVLNSEKDKNLYKEAFLNGYYAFTMQNFYSLKISKLVTDINMKTFLNQDNKEQGFSIGMLSKITNNLTKFSELIPLNIGRIFYSILKRDELIPLNIKKDIDVFLRSTDENTSFYAKLIIVKPLSFVENTAYKLWYPIQKRLALRISKIKISLRKNLINERVINKYRDKFEPCDIFLERKEWRITNIGIPGFWTHSAMYLGEMSDLDGFFNGIKDLNGVSFSKYVENNFPNIFYKFSSNDENKFKFSVIESARDGVVFTSLEYTTKADSLAVLRLKKLSKEQKFKIILNAFKYYGTPYDFNYSFARYDGILCSELIYKSYQGISNINIDLDYINGEPIVTPNMFAKKFAKEYNTKNEELKLVLFLDGDEKGRIANRKGRRDFIETWRRPMWHIVKDYF